jgi:hypothetical protein
MGAGVAAKGIGVGFDDEAGSGIKGADASGDTTTTGGEVVPADPTEPPTRFTPPGTGEVGRTVIREGACATGGVAPGGNAGFMTGGVIPEGIPGVERSRTVSGRAATGGRRTWVALSFTVSLPAVGEPGFGGKVTRIVSGDGLEGGFGGRGEFSDMGVILSSLFPFARAACQTTSPRGRPGFWVGVPPCPAFLEAASLAG